MTFEFMIHHWSDSENTNNPEKQRTISGTRVSLERCPIMFRSGTQMYLCLSAIKAELNTGDTCAQDMLNVMQVLQ